MTATEPTSDREKKIIEDRYIESLQQRADHLKHELDELVDALKDGTADSQQIWDDITLLTYAYVQIEDAAHETGVIDATEPASRAANQSRKAMYHAAQANRTDETERELISPSPGRSWDTVVETAAAATQYATVARGETDDDDRWTYEAPASAHAGAEPTIEARGELDIRPIVDDSIQLVTSVDGDEIGTGINLDADQAEAVAIDLLEQAQVIRNAESHDTDE